MIFLIAMDADYTFYVKSIETHVRAFLPLNISAVSSVFSPLETANIGNLKLALCLLFAIGSAQKGSKTILINNNNPTWL